MQGRWSSSGVHHDQVPNATIRNGTRGRLLQLIAAWCRGRSAAINVLLRVRGGDLLDHGCHGLSSCVVVSGSCGCLRGHEVGPTYEGRLELLVLLLQVQSILVKLLNGGFPRARQSIMVRL